MSHVPMSAGRTLPFSPPALGTFVPASEDGATPARTILNPDIEFYLRVPTWEDRDMIALRMYALGVRDISSDQIQALIVSELYTVFDENTADEHARFLEGYWSRQQQYQRDLADWSEQEALRRSDEREAGMSFDPVPPPQEASTPRERAKVNELVSDVTDASAKLRNKLADQQLYATRFKITTLRLHLVGWKGLKTTAAWDPQLALDVQALTKATIEGLRSELMEMDSTGAAWDELCSECEHLFDLPRSAEKNSSSLTANSPPPDGSPTKNTESATSAGSSTSSEPTADRPA
jgi:hypothetical protein